MEQATKPLNKRKPTRRFWFWLGVITWFGFGYLLLNSTPDEVGPLGITAFFLLMAVGIFTVLMWLRAKAFKQPSSTSLLAAILISLLTTGTLALNTIDIQAGEIFLLVVFGAMLSIYWLKVRRSS